jgi:toxin ParE1/3/4
MSQRRARLTSAAHRDLEGIAKYIGAHNPSAADRVIDALIETFSLLAENASLGALRDDLRAGLRVFSPPRPAHNYVVLYYDAPEGIEVIAVYHGAREWPELITHGER